MFSDEGISSLPTIRDAEVLFRMYKSQCDFFGLQCRENEPVTQEEYFEMKRKLRKMRERTRFEIILMKLSDSLEI